MPVPSKIRSPSLAEQLLIVPAAHTRLGHAAFQAEMYELFHRASGTRIGHMIGTPTILLGAFLLATRVTAAPVVVSAMACGIAAWGAVVDRVVGLVTALVTALLAASAFMLAHALGPDTALVVALACALGGCATQTFSHAFEDVPPPLSGTTGFMPVIAWLRCVRLLGAARAAVLTFGVFFWLEMWAAFRILPLQILHLLMQAGHRPELRRAFDARVVAILAAPAGDWRRPEEPGRTPRDAALPTTGGDPRGAAR